MIKSIEPLGNHERAAFSCAVAALDDWFHTRAGQDEKRNMARVFVPSTINAGLSISPCRFRIENGLNAQWRSPVIKLAIVHLLTPS